MQLLAFSDSLMLPISQLAYHDPPTTAVLSWSTSPAAVSLREALVVEGIKGE